MGGEKSCCRGWGGTHSTGSAPRHRAGSGAGHGAGSRWLQHGDVGQGDVWGQPGCRSSTAGLCVCGRGGQNPKKSPLPRAAERRPSGSRQGADCCLLEEKASLCLIYRGFNNSPLLGRNSLASNAAGSGAGGVGLFMGVSSPELTETPPGDARFGVNPAQPHRIIVGSPNCCWTQSLSSPQAPLGGHRDAAPHPAHRGDRDGAPTPSAGTRQSPNSCTEIRGAIPNCASCTHPGSHTDSSVSQPGAVSATFCHWVLP